MHFKVHDVHPAHGPAASVGRSVSHKASWLLLLRIEAQKQNPSKQKRLKLKTVTRMATAQEATREILCLLHKSVDTTSLIR